MTDTDILPELWRITFNGETPGGEIFSHGMWVTADTGSTPTNVGDAGDAWLDAFLGSSAVLVSPSTVLGLFAIGVDWHTIVVRPYTIATGVPITLPTTFSIAHAGTASSMLPPQVAFVATLYNGRAIGRRKYNRFYLPPMGAVATNGAGRANSQLGNVINTAVVAGNTAMQALTPEVAMCYYSPTFHDVLALVDVQCDDVFDTQRRRDDQLTPVRVFLDF